MGIYRFGDTNPEAPYDTQIPKIYWIAGHTFSKATGGQSIDKLNQDAISAANNGNITKLTEITDQFCEAHRLMAKDAKNGGYEFVMFDHEHVSIKTILLASIDAFYEEWHPPKSSCYLGWFDAGNRNDIAAAIKDKNHWLHSRTEYWRDVWNKMTHLHVGSYMLGRKPEEWNRDIECIRGTNILRDMHYPNKSVCYSVWYRLHTSWNPWPTQMTNQEIDQYHSALTNTLGDYIYFEFRWQLAPESEGSWDMHWDAGKYYKLLRMINRPPARSLYRPGTRYPIGGLE